MKIWKVLLKALINDCNLYVRTEYKDINQKFPKIIIELPYDQAMPCNIFIY